MMIPFDALTSGSMRMRSLPQLSSTSSLSFLFTGCGQERPRHRRPLVTPKKTVPEIASYMSEIIGTRVNAVPVPQEQWFETFKKAGMHDEQANLLSR